jgi:hypothetical protein
MLHQKGDPHPDEDRLAKLENEWRWHIQRRNGLLVMRRTE